MIELIGLTRKIDLKVDLDDGLTDRISRVIASHMVDNSFICRKEVMEEANCKPFS